MRDIFPYSPAKGVAHELSFRITILAPTLLGPPTSRQGDTWRWRSRGSLAVHISDPKRGRFRDYESGEHGDALDLIRHVLGLPTRDACRWGAEWLGGAATPAPPQRLHVVPTGQVVDRRDLARRIWNESLPPAGSPVETYLGTRGLALMPDLPLRYHPRCPRGAQVLPAMVARVDCPVSGAPLGVHRTFLRPDGLGKAAVEPTKMLLGGAGTIRLVGEVTIGLGIAEGIETTLSIVQHAAWCPVWAADSAAGIEAFPVLQGIDALTIFVDSDDGGAGLRTGLSCAARWRAAGRQANVWCAPVGADFFDALHGDGQ